MILILEPMQSVEWRRGPLHIPHENILYYEPHAHYSDVGNRTDGSVVMLKSDKVMTQIFVAETPEEIDKEMQNA